MTIEHIDFDDPAPLLPLDQDEERIGEGIQGEQSWLNARVGFITASKMADVMSDGGKLIREKYLYRLAVERLTGTPAPEGFKSKRMQKGNELEPDARDFYAMINCVDVEECGFIQHPTIEKFGASPDGIIKEGNGLLEIKNRDVHIHLGLMTSDKPPRAAVLQCYSQLACTTADWVDYCSYCEHMPPKLRLHTVRIERNNDEIAVIEKAVKKFDKDIEILVNKLRGMQ